MNNNLIYANLQASDVKKLREETGAGMMECKRMLCDKKFREYITKLRGNNIGSDYLVADMLEYLLDRNSHFSCGPC